MAWYCSPYRKRSGRAGHKTQRSVQKLNGHGTCRADDDQGRGDGKSNNPGKCRGCCIIQQFSSLTKGQRIVAASPFSILIGDFIIQRIEAAPHLTLHRLKGKLAQRGVKVPHGASWTFMRRQGLRLLPLNRPVPTSGLGGNSGVPASQIWTPCVAGGP